MAATVSRKPKVRSEDKILDQATDQLLRAIKQHSAGKGRKLDRAQLLNEGYSERFVAKAEKV